MMGSTFLTYALRFLLFLLGQTLVFHYIRLFGYAMPLIYVYFVLLFPSKTPRYLPLLWSFALGVLLDMFTDTPGVASASLTFLAMIQPHLLRLFLSNDTTDSIIPSFHTLGWKRFHYYATTGSFVYASLYYALESFSFFNWEDLLLKAIGSSVLTALFIAVLESLRSMGRK